MSLKYNGTIINRVNYNTTRLEYLNYNGTRVYSYYDQVMALYNNGTKYQCAVTSTKYSYSGGSSRYLYYITNCEHNSWYIIKYQSTYYLALMAKSSDGSFTFSNCVRLMTGTDLPFFTNTDGKPNTSDIVKYFRVFKGGEYSSNPKYQTYCLTIGSTSTRSLLVNYVKIGASDWLRYD